MNAVSKALDEVMFRIPRQVLEAVFLNRSRVWNAPPESMSSRILNSVLRPRVFIDCDLIGGTEAYVRLEGLGFDRPNDFTTIYRIPKDRTQGRVITAVLNITFNDPTGTSYYGLSTGCQSTQLMALAQGLVDTAGTIPVTTTSTVQLIGENVVMVKDTTLLPSTTFLRCILANDETMSHLQLRTYRQFSKLVELAVKAYVYNELVINVDIAELYGGHALGRFKEIIDGYADANELYETYLREKWQRISLMNDAESYGRFLRLVVGGQR